MYLKPLIFSATASVLATSVLSAPVEAISLLEMSNTYTVNSGSVPTGIRVNNTPGTLEISGSAETELDHPDSSVTDTPFAQVGNPFSDPVTPYLAQRTIIETTPVNDPRARATYDVSIYARDDPDANPLDTSIVERTIDNSGEASVSSQSGADTGSALSRYSSERTYTFENTTRELISFNIVGIMDAVLSASVDGGMGLARTSAVLFTELTPSAGVSVNFLGLSPYIANVDETGPGATATELLSADAGGVFFSAGTTAIGDALSADASIDMNFRYFFGISMEGGSTFDLRSGFAQVNSAEITGAVSPVPLPATLPMLLAGLFGMRMLRARLRS